MATEYIAYYRVSTQKQGRSGLGLEAQRALVHKYASCTADATIIHEYTEVDSGKKRERPIFQQAVEHCKRTGAILLVGAISRIDRTAHLVLDLHDAVQRGELRKFIACDMPAATELTINIHAMIYREEGRLVSERTKAALAAKKARGEKVGNPANFNKSRSKALEASIATRVQQRVECEQWQRAAVVAKSMRAADATLRAIAAELNTNGFVTRNGKQFNANTVQRLLAR
jgi:DNA invertase Pin-like site-specific DNA recombinase